MRTSFCAVAFVFVFEILSAQSGRYQKSVFDSVILTSNIQYGEADFYDANSNHDLDSLYLDFYEPFGDTFSKRPLVITIFGGAFIAGNKEWEDMKAWCDSLSRYGYACASIQYRLLFDVFNSKESTVRASYRAVQDTRAAIRFLKEYATDYRIDTSKMFLLGNSAGSITALHTVFLSKESERPAQTFGLATASDNYDLGCLDCSGDTFAHTVKLAGIISLWGGVWDINWVEADEGIPALLIQGTADGAVPYDTGYAFGISTLAPFTYGSLPIDRKMILLGIPHEFHPFEGLWHSFYMTEDTLDFPNQYWEPVFELGQAFLYKVINNLPLEVSDIPEAEIAVFPNPTSGVLYLNLPENFSGTQNISLLNMQGVKIKSWQFSSTTQPIDVADVPKGIYLVRVQAGSKQYARKVMVY